MEDKEKGNMPRVDVVVVGAAVVVVAVALMVGHRHKALALEQEDNTVFYEMGSSLEQHSKFPADYLPILKMDSELQVISSQLLMWNIVSPVTDDDDELLNTH